MGRWRGENSLFRFVCFFFFCFLCRPETSKKNLFPFLSRKRKRRSRERVVARRRFLEFFPRFGSSKRRNRRKKNAQLVFITLYSCSPPRAGSPSPESCSPRLSSLSVPSPPSWLPLAASRRTAEAETPFRSTKREGREQQPSSLPVHQTINRKHLPP